MSPLHTPTSTYYIAATYPYYSNNSSTDDEHFRLAIFCSARLACQISFHSMFHGALGRECGMNEGNLLLLCENKINFAPHTM